MFFFGRLRLGLSPDKFYLPCHMNDRGGGEEMAKGRRTRASTRAGQRNRGLLASIIDIALIFYN